MQRLTLCAVACMSLPTLYTFAWDMPLLLATVGGIAVFGVSIVHVRATQKHLLQRGVALITACASGAWSCLFLYGIFVEPQLLTVTTIPVRLPVSQPLRVVVLSDMHMGAYKGPAYLQRVVQKTNELMPDIVLLAGDYILADTPATAAADALAPLANLRPAVGTFGVLGNHDHGLFSIFGNLHDPASDHSDVLARALETANVTVLSNSSALLTLGLDRIAIAGIEDHWMPDSDVGKALKGIPANVPTLLVAHNPDVALDPRSAAARIIVTGHTHGGQIRLPGIGPLPRLPTRLGRVYDQGLFRIHDNTALIITRGVGESGPRMRLFAPPEVLLLDIQPEEEPASAAE